jgi:hypothetical protein
MINLIKFKSKEIKMSWKPEVFVDGEWGGNAMAFATKEEAEEWARDLLNRWFVPTDSRAVESDEEVNYEIKGGVLGRFADAVFNPLPFEA